MSELKTAADKVEAETAALKNDAIADFNTAQGYVKVHFVWLTGLLSFIVGFVAGHFVS
jgi:hypothetical protein